MTTITSTFEELMSSTAVRARAAADRRQQRVRARRVTASAALAVLGLVRAYLTVLLSVAGLSSLVYAAFTMGVTMGFTATGVALLLLGFYAESEGRP